MDDKPPVVDTLERLFARAEAAEARVAELEAAIADKKTFGNVGYKLGAADMRERAAKEVENLRVSVTGAYRENAGKSYRSQMAAAIRALPLDTKKAAPPKQDGL